MWDRCWWRRRGEKSWRSGGCADDHGRTLPRAPIEGIRASGLRTETHVSAGHVSTRSINMRPFKGSSRMEVGSTTAPTLASLVCKTSAAANTWTPSLTEATARVISTLSFWPTSAAGTALPLQNQLIRLSVRNHLARVLEPRMSILVCHQAPHCAVFAAVSWTVAPATGRCCWSLTTPVRAAKFALAIRRQREAQKKKNEAESLHDGCPSRKNAR